MREYRGTLTEPGKNSPYRDRSRGREPRSVPADEERRIPRRLADAAGQDRHGLAQLQHARPGHVPHPARHASPHGRQVVHLPDVRLHARRERFASSGSRIRSARWSSRTTGRCTTGISKQLGIYHPQQIEFARLNLTYTVMSKRKLLELVQGRPRDRLGRSAHADASAACAAAATRPRPCATSARRSAWRNTTA